jgi:mannose-1-phosphate guanylyltransferase/phosphomannomutase
MKAVIMAGGEGTRLRPLTCDMPKPMARLCGKPVLEYMIEKLSKNGVDEAMLALRYLPSAISDHFPDNVFAGVKLQFVVEEEPLGTAGGVKNAVGDSNEDILVLSGDGLCDFNFAAAIKFHKERGAAATLVLTHVADPREYGLVVTEPDGRVRGFVEKPGWAQSVTDAVNTGIYILSPQSLALIPSGKEFDFAKDLFPLMISKGMPLYSFDAEGYWCDIGDIGAYVSCQHDMLEGRVDCELPGFKQGGIFCKSSMPPGNYTILPPIYIGENVRIADFAQIGPFAVIDDGCTIGSGTTIINSVLLENVYVGEHCELRGTLICAGASLKKRAGMFEGSVAGANSVIGADAAVSPGVKIWPGKKVEDGARAAVNIKFGSARNGIFDDEGISGEIGVELTPEFCAKIGATAGGSAGENIGVADDGSNAGVAFKNAIISGAISSGAKIYDFGSCFETLLNFAVSFCGCGLGLFARSAGSRAVLRLIDGSGLTLNRTQERKMDHAFSTGEFRRCTPLDYGRPLLMSGIRAVYTSQLKKLAPERLSGLYVTVHSTNKEVSHLLRETLHELGCSEGGIKIHITASGGSASFFDENGDYIDAARALALGCIVAFENGEDVALPFEAPRAIDTLAARYNRRVLRYLSCPADSSDKAARAAAAGQPWVRDGLQNAVRILHYLKVNSISLCDFTKKLPLFAISIKAVSLSGNPGSLLRRLSVDQEHREGPTEGVLLSSGSGKVLLSPLKRGTGLRILAEAANMEAADEICEEFEKKLHEHEILDRS